MTVFRDAKKMSLQNLPGWSSTCPVCKAGSIKVNATHWHCLSCKAGGTVIDYAAALWGVSIRQAAERLAELQGAEGELPDASKEVSQSAVEHALAQILRHAHTKVPEAVSYLKGRGISERTVEEAVQRGLLRFLPANPFKARKVLFEWVGVDRLREAGLLKPSSQWPAAAFRPLVFFFPNGCAAEFRLAREPRGGEPKAVQYGSIRWPWWWRKEGGPVTTIYVVEGVIDLLSMVEMGLGKGEAVIALPGANSWKPQWFQEANKAHPGARFVLALDADEAGDAASLSILRELREAGIACSRTRPSGKDWNEVLVSRKVA